MSQPVPINSARRELPPRGGSHSSLHAYPLGSSPGTLEPSSPFGYAHAPLGHSPVFGSALTGSSPPARGGSSVDKSNPYAGAKKFWKRLLFDHSLDPRDYAIGFIETVQQPERKSGAEAWSMRLHDRLLELPFAQFCARFNCAAPTSPFANTNPMYGVDFHSGGGGAGMHWMQEACSPGIRGSVMATAGHCQPDEIPSPAPGGSSHGDVPFHRIAYFKCQGAVVWESEHFKRRMAELGGPLQASGQGHGRRSSRDGLPPLTPTGQQAGRTAAASLLGPGMHKVPSMSKTLKLAGGCSDEGDDDADSGSEDEGAEASSGEAGEGEPGEGGGAVPQLPEQCWMMILRQLGVREVCMVGRTNRWLRQLAADPAVWLAQYEGLFGEAPEAQWAPAMVRRMCRRSELRAARWLEAQVQGQPMGFPSTGCLQLDDSKVVSADGSAVRLWSHTSGRRIATLQGHTGRVTSVAFDEELIVSGCTASVVKLWGMDDLKCRRTLRGHEGAVTCVALLPSNGIPLSGSDDCTIKLWDVSSGTAILSLEAGHPIMAMQGHAQSGVLVSAGWGVQLWDVSAAALKASLEDPAGAGAAAEHPFTCVSYSGELLAAGRQGEVVLYDPRVASVVGRLACLDAPLTAGVCVSAADQPALLPSPSQAVSGAACADGSVGDGAFGSSAGAAIAAAALGEMAAGGGFSAPGRLAPCIGVQLDEWKLVCGFNDGLNQLQVHDIRALSKGHAASSRGSWQAPLMCLTAPGRINAFQFHEQALLVALEGQECLKWHFERPTAEPMASTAGGGGALSPRAGGGGGRQRTPALLGMAQEGGGGGCGKEKKKPAKVAKKQTRYPKRNTK